MFKFSQCHILLSVPIYTHKEETAHSTFLESKLLFISALMERIQRNSHFLRVQRYTYYSIRTTYVYLYL